MERGQHAQRCKRGQAIKRKGAGQAPFLMVMAWLCELATQDHNQLTPNPTLAIGRGLHPFNKLFQTSEHMLRVFMVGLDDLHHGGA
jgi:hypothetical protein